MFDNLPALSTFDVGSVADELDIYLKSPVANIAVCDGISWWYSEKETYPHLYQMALDYLSIPGTLLYY